MPTTPTATRVPSVAVILVNWYGWRDTVECLDSLLGLKGGGRLHVVVVDNASADDSVDRLKSWMLHRGAMTDGVPTFLSSRLGGAASVRVGELVEVSLLCNRKNDGFAAANNIGIQYASHVGAVDYFWILNNDTLVDADALHLLCRRMIQDDRIGICGNTLIHTGPSQRVQAYGGVKYSLATARGFHIGAGSTYTGPVDNVGVERCLSYVSGASMLVRRQFIDQIGLMEERYFLYNEEMDWAWRGRKKFRLGVETAAVVYHKEGASIGTETEERPASLLSDFYQTRNKLMFAQRHTPWLMATVWLSLAVRTFKRWRAGHRRNAWLMMQVLGGRRVPDPAWFLKG